MAEPGHVDADLVGAAGGQAQREECGGGPALEHGVVRQRRLARPVDLLQHPAARRRGDGLRYRPRLVDQLAGDQGAVFPPEPAGLQLAEQATVDPGVAGKEHQAGGVAVKPVQGPHRRLHTLLAPAPGDGVGQSAALLLLHRVDQLGGRLVDHQQVVVLVNDAQGQVLRQESGGGVFRQPQHHLVARLQPVVDPLLTAVDQQPLRPLETGEQGVGDAKLAAQQRPQGAPGVGGLHHVAEKFGHAIPPPGPGRSRRRYRQSPRCRR